MSSGQSAPAGGEPVLVCYDGSENAQEAIAAAGRLFPGLAAVVLHVWEPLREVASPPPIPGLQGMLMAGLDEMDETGHELSEKVAAEGAERARDAGLDAHPLSVARSGRAWRNILDIADEHDARAIVVGQRGLSAAGRALLGSVSSAVVNRSARPVVVVPSRAQAD